MKEKQFQDNLEPPSLPEVGADLGLELFGAESALGEQVFLPAVLAEVMAEHAPEIAELMVRAGQPGGLGQEDLARVESLRVEIKRRLAAEVSTAASMGRNHS